MHIGRIYASASDPIHIEAEAEAEAFSEGVVTAVNQLQYIHVARHDSVTERRH